MKNYERLYNQLMREMNEGFDSDQIIQEQSEEHPYNNSMKEDPIYSIIFHTKEDFNEAVGIISLILPDEYNLGDLEMAWHQEWWRDNAVNELDKIGIEVDTYDM